MSKEASSRASRPFLFTLAQPAFSNATILAQPAFSNATNAAAKAKNLFVPSWRTVLMLNAMATLSTVLDRMGRCEPAATIAGFALSPLSAAAAREITTTIAHLREVLGDQTYESLAREDETMTTAEMVTYAYDQIDQARAELNAVSK
jgi:hypothetical protein